MLADQSLSVDTAESGEEALEYLRYARPDVIFMDHMMPGMDGLQALEAIKENPATATIPVMMYTSQEGELYVGQARALGAIGVLPKQVHAVEVTKVLEALHLTADKTDQTMDGPVNAEAAGRSEVSALLEELFKEQRAVLRDDIRRGYEHVVETTASYRQLEPAATSSETQPRPLVIGLAILAAISACFAYLYYDAQSLLAQADGRISVLIEGLRTDTLSLDEEPASDGAADVSAAGNGAADILEILEWGANQGQSYAFGEIALNDRRAQLLLQLSQRLRGIGFAGTMAVDVHVGRYCMNRGLDGVLILPPAAQLFEECQQVGWPEAETLVFGAQQTLPFANAISLESRDGTIDFRIVSHGASQPRSAYPSFTQGLTAGEWNEIAARNQRVEVRILPD